MVVKWVYIHAGIRIQRHVFENVYIISQEVNFCLRKLILAKKKLFYKRDEDFKSYAN